MRRRQGQKAQQRDSRRAALDKFIERPCRLSPQHAEALLNELCAVGFCLAPADYESVVADPPTDPQAFAERVVELEIGVLDPEAVEEILPIVLATFEGIAGRDQC